MDRQIRSIGELEQEARDFVSRLEKDARSATVVALSGELGAGKTAFTKAAAKALGIEEQVTSPTFVLEKIYALQGDTRFTRLVHIDAYRLSGPEELHALGFDELLKSPETLLFLEWPERVAGAVPERAKRISLTIESDGSRTLSYA